MYNLTTCRKVLLLAAVIAVCVTPNNLNTTHGQNYSGSSSRAAEASAPNPLLAKWEGPYGGVPPFDRVQVALFKPALESAMAENLAEVDRIAKDPAAPTFENTIAALERAGSTLDRVQTIYDVWSST